MQVICCLKVMDDDDDERYDTDATAARRSAQKTKMD